VETNIIPGQVVRMLALWSTGHEFKS